MGVFDVFLNSTKLKIKFQSDLQLKLIETADENFISRYLSTIIRCIRLCQLVIETLVQELVLFLGAEDSDAFLSHGHHSLINFQLGHCGVLAVLDCHVGSKEEAGPAGAITTVNQERSGRHCGREEWFIFNYLDEKIPLSSSGIKLSGFLGNLIFFCWPSSDSTSECSYSEVLSLEKSIYQLHPSK